MAPGSCPRCAEALGSNSRFCPRCGLALASAPPVAEQGQSLPPKTLTTGGTHRSTGSQVSQLAKLEAAREDLRDTKRNSNLLVIAGIALIAIAVFSWTAPADIVSFPSWSVPVIFVLGGVFMAISFAAYRTYVSKLNVLKRGQI